jgi:hypothetical protein
VKVVLQLNGRELKELLAHLGADTPTLRKVREQLEAAVDEDEARCRYVWKPGVLRPPDAPELTGRCIRPAGHEGEHKLRIAARPPAPR